MLEFIENVFNIWKSGNLELKRMVLRLVFTDYLSYSKNNGFQTASLSVIYKVFDLSVNTETSMVDLNPKTSNQLIEIIIKWGNVLESQNYQHLLEKKGLVEPDEVKQAKHYHLT